jgi:uncharacterized protein YutE (UPF0331/DUF86 family)
MFSDAAFLERIDAVLQRVDQIKPGDDTSAVETECIARTTTLIEALYGANSSQIKQFLSAVAEINSTFGFTESAWFVVRTVRGTLTAARVDVAAGRVGELIDLAASEIILDFIMLAQRALDDGRVDVAAVLSAAAFEDVVRRKAQKAGVDVADKDLSDLINALKAAGVLSKPQAQVASAYVTFRNKALHADWGKLLPPEVAGLISFVKHFAAHI